MNETAPPMRSLKDWTLVLMVGVLLCGAAAARYSVARHKDAGNSAATDSDSQRPSDFTEADRSAGLEMTEAASMNQLPVTGAGPRRESVESFQEWFQKYRAANPDDRRLRRELEAALAQLPPDPNAATASDADAAFDALRRAEQTAGDDYASLLDQAERFLALYPTSSHAAEVRELFNKTARAWDDRDFESAREYSQQNPDSFETRLARYQRYLDRHAVAGQHVADATRAIQTLRAEWAEHDYRAIYEFYRQYPTDLVSVAGRVRQFLSSHPSSHRVNTANEFLAKYERAAAPRDYRIRVKSGVFDHAIKRSLSFGPDLAVEVEVAGVRVGRTPIVTDSFEPVWNYEFPQNVRWRMGDPVQIRVIDFDYGNRTVLKVDSADDPLALRYLSSSITAQGHHLSFECDFQAPTLPSP